jgi:hypothetical protein
MPERKKSLKVTPKKVDAIPGKRGRGRPRLCRYIEIVGRAQNYRGIFKGIWERLSGPLLAARNEEEVTKAFRTLAQPYTNEFVPRLAADILEVLREKKFPKKPRAQIKFLANSLAGRPNVEARTSRDICAMGLAEEKARSPHKILRKEFYVECSCGFKGPALNNACRKCGAPIPIFLGSLEGAQSF